MNKLLKFLGFIVGWIAPFGVVYVNHVVIVDGYDVDMFGLLIIIAIIFGLIKRADDRIEKWDIQNRNKVFILSWKNGKKIATALLLTWILFTIQDNLPKLQLTAILISVCFIAGFVLTLLGNLRSPKKGDTQ